MLISTRQEERVAWSAELLNVALVFFVQATAARGQQQLDGRSGTGITGTKRNAKCCLSDENQKCMQQASILDFGAT